MSHNLLGRLPQGIENVRNLSILDLSYNKLIYLPAGITNLRLQTIDITMNPLVVISHPKWECELIMPSLTQFAAKALQRYCKYVAFFDLILYNVILAKIEYIAQVPIS